VRRSKEERNKEEGVEQKGIRRKVRRSYEERNKQLAANSLGDYDVTQCHFFNPKPQSFTNATAQNSKP